MNRKFKTGVLSKLEHKSWNRWLKAALRWNCEKAYFSNEVIFMDVTHIHIKPHNMPEIKLTEFLSLTVNGLNVGFFDVVHCSANSVGRLML